MLALIQEHLISIFYCFFRLIFIIILIIPERGWVSGCDNCFRNIGDALIFLWAFLMIIIINVAYARTCTHNIKYTLPYVLDVIESIKCVFVLRSYNGIVYLTILISTGLMMGMNIIVYSILERKNRERNMISSSNDNSSVENTNPDRNDTVINMNNIAAN